MNTQPPAETYPSYTKAEIGQLCLAPKENMRDEYFQWFYRPNDGWVNLKDVPTVKVAGTIRVFVKVDHTTIANLFKRVS